MNNEIEKGKTKAKRKLKALDFTGNDAAIALVSESQGGPANGHNYALVVKCTNFSDEFIEKASQVTVTMEITEYLKRFFGLWNTDAELLARSLGFTTAGMEKAELERQEEMLESNEPPEYPNWESEPGDKEFEDWITSQLTSIDVMKSLYDSESVAEVLSALDEGEYLQFLKDQQRVEKAFGTIEKLDKGYDKGGRKKKVKLVSKESTEVANATDGDTSTINASVESEVGVTAPVVKQSNKENKSMTKETVQVVEKEVEVVEKSQFEAIQKQLQDQQVELQKALDLVKQFEQEKKEAIAKSRKESLNKACGKHAEVIFKACGEVSEEVFVEVVKALAEMQATIEKSALFQEQGASVSAEEDASETPIAKALKARLAKNKQ